MMMVVHETWFLILILVLVLPQIVTFAIYGIDKFLAKVSGPRVPELVLLASSFLFGGMGSLAAMRLFRHKTSKTSFKVKFYIIWTLRVLLLVGLGLVYLFYIR